MPKQRNILFFLLVSLLMGFASCADESGLDTPADASPIALRGIHADIEGAREARAVAPLVDMIGKYEFFPTDEIIFTLIERTKRPIRPTFSYSDVHYSCAINDGNISWKREQPTTDIYWSDGSEPHTFVGYILPHADEQTADATGYDWNAETSTWRQTGYDWHHDTGRHMYYGSIGNPVNPAEVIDYQGSDALQEDADTRYSTERLRKEDLLLTYSTEMQNQDAMAWIRFHHGLASVRVTVTITGYSSTGVDADAETKVTNMLLKDQPTMYKWDDASYTTAPLEEADQQVLGSFTDWGGTAPAWYQKKDMILWQPREFHGSGASRTFTFYGITTPGQQDKVTTHFHVSYPDPLDPNHIERLQKDYTAVLDLGAGHPIEFRPGYCTSININLNHKDEKMTVGAEYMSWQYIDQPDEGALRKNTTFLSYTDRSKVTILGDELATADDATWLYTSTSGKIVDIYGNDGTPQHPFLICTADQLLSFAHEVKGTSRRATTYHNVVTNTDASLGAGASFDFAGYYVKLDADITMQSSTTDTNLEWIGVGDATHKFNGIFLGSGRYIKRLYGQPLFCEIGDYAVVDKVNFDNVLNVVGSGVVANINNGLICGCNVEGNVEQAQPSGSGDSYCGSFVGDNRSFIVACTHVGNVTGYGYVGGLVGRNAGAIVASYHAGLVSYASDATTDQQKNIGGSTGLKDDTKSVIFSCYQNGDFISHKPNLLPCRAAWPLTTTQMQSGSFVNSTEDNIFGLTNTPPTDGYTPYIAGADHHYSLNHALQEFSSWVKTKADTGADVDLPCHTFTAHQVQVLNSLFSKDSNGQLVPAHLYKYVPGTYPKVQ